MAPASLPLVRSASPSIADRERSALLAHKETLRGSGLPPPKHIAGGTFLHGFLLPFSLIVSTLRHPTLGLSYLKVALVRSIVVALCAWVAFSHAKPNDEHRARDKRAHRTSSNIHFQAMSTPAGSSSVSPNPSATTVSILGKTFVVEAKEDAPSPDEAVAKLAEDDARPAIVKALTSKWSWLVWFIGIVSATEAFVVFFSRRWDDWLSFHSSLLARIRPEDDFPKQPKIALDFKWLIKKLKRRVRGYIVFGAGVPLIAVFKLVPMLGELLFAIGLTAWGWYWLAVFTAAKSAHAWADDGHAPPPFLIREIRDRSVGLWYFAPFRLYGRVWAWLTQSVSSAAQTFERNPAPYLGLALARVILSLPGIYLFARPIVPVAAGRICAEADPDDRFSLPQ